MSRRLKAELVAYRICKQPLPSFMHLLALKPDRSSVCPVCLESFSTSSWFQNPIAIKSSIRIDRMSNQWKDEFINGNFGIWSFWGGHNKILSKSWFRPKGRICPEFWLSNPVEFSTAITHKSLTIWDCTRDHRKGERVAYCNGIWDSWSFGQSETQNLSFFSAAILSSTDFSGVVIAQNSVSFKLLVGWDFMSIQWKAGRVVQVFCIQLKGRIPPKQSQI
jgi:hypothetical protein